MSDPVGGDTTQRSSAGRSLMPSSDLARRVVASRPQSSWQGLSPVFVREAAAERLKALAHPERLRIVEVLAGEPRTVTEICAQLDRPMSVVSRNLRVLRDAQLVRRSKRGNSVLYVLADKDVARLAAVAYRGAGSQVQKTLALSSPGDNKAT
jgi:ArsR family transcriptional regulator